MSAYTELVDQILSEAKVRDKYTATEVASYISDSDPDLVLRWLKENEFTLLTQFVSDMLRRARGRLTVERRRTGWSMYDQSFVVNDDLQRMALGDMTATEHRYVASNYAREAAQSKHHEGLHLLIAKRVGKRPTREVFSEEQLESLFGVATEKSDAA